MVWKDLLVSWVHDSLTDVISITSILEETPVYSVISIYVIFKCTSKIDFLRDIEEVLKSWNINWVRVIKPFKIFECFYFRSLLVWWVFIDNNCKTNN